MTLATPQYNSSSASDSAARIDERRARLRQDLKDAMRLSMELDAARAANFDTLYFERLLTLGFDDFSSVPGNSDEERFEFQRFTLDCLLRQRAQQNSAPDLPAERIQALLDDLTAFKSLLEDRRSFFYQPRFQWRARLRRPFRFRPLPCPDADTALFSISGDLYSREELLCEVERMLEAAAADSRKDYILLDCGRLISFGSMGLGTFVKVTDQINRVRPRVALFNVPAKIKIVIQMLNLEAFFGVARSYKSARELVRARRAERSLNH